MNLGRVVLIVSCVVVAALGVWFALANWDTANQIAATVSALGAVAAVGVSVWAALRTRPSEVTAGAAEDVDGRPVLTRYRHQVRRIAPPVLEGRDDELAELATFCTSPETAGTYAWWRADAWSGKTALMSWFALHPPEGVRVVSFFVTARYAAQNDRHACIENLMEQLLALLGKEWPADLGESRYEANLLGLLTEAAEAAAGRGENFVLLVDGLDEDRGVAAGPDSHSIAALLPSAPPAGMRVVVTGRPHPPVPSDVPPDHPLHDSAIVRTLTPSPRAQAIRVEMERDLERLLEGTDIERDLLGLVAAAGGGLSSGDLAELTGESQVGRHLRSVAARSFSVRDGQDVYLLGHEEIQAAALDMLGPDRLRDYRGRLHDWAERYRDRHWPDDTPEYLLHGYFRMLTAAGDTARMVAYAADRHRHDRMLELTGGDAVTLSEIGTAHDVIAAQEQPDLCALLRLAIHRDRLGGRNREIPVALPAVWATLGDVDRAESIANSIADPGKRVKALTAVATATAEAGDRDRATRLLDAAEETAGTIADIGPDLQAHALAQVAGAVAETGDLDRAEGLTRTIAEHQNAHAFALAWLARAALKAGDADRAERLTDTIIAHPHRFYALPLVAEAFAEAGDSSRAERLARAIDHGYWRKRALGRVAEAVAAAGDPEGAEQLARTIADSPVLHAEALAMVAGAAAPAARATRLLDEAEGIARTLTKPHDVEDVLQQVAESRARAGEFDRAEQLAGTIRYTHPPHWTDTVTRVAEAMARAGDVDRAERIAGRISYPSSLAEALTRVAAVAAKAGESDRAARLLARAEQGARTTIARRSTLEALARAAGMVAEAGDFDRAERLAGTITSSHWRATALARITGAVAEAGDVDRAERIARTITDNDPHWKVEALSQVAGAVAKGGDLGRAERIARSLKEFYHQEDVLERVAEALAEAGDVGGAEHVARTISSGDQAPALSRVARAVARTGDIERAEQLTRAISDHSSFWYARTLAQVAGVVAETGEPTRAAHLLDDAEQVASTYTERFPANRVTVLTAVAEAAAKAGQPERATRLLDDAEQIAGTIGHTYSRADALTRIAAAVAEAGDFDRAERLANTITLDRSHRAIALVRLAQSRSIPRRNHVVADVLRLDDWQLSVDVLAELAPASVEVILTELA